MVIAEVVLVLEHLKLLVFHIAAYEIGRLDDAGFGLVTIQIGNASVREHRLRLVVKQLKDILLAPFSTINQSV